MAKEALSSITIHFVSLDRDIVQNVIDVFGDEYPNITAEEMF